MNHQGLAPDLDCLTGEGLTELETAAGFSFGGRARALPSGGARSSPRAALTDVLTAFVRSEGSPAVAFSGGRDSSLLLAMTAGVCRSLGVEPPLAVTLCFPSIPEADEREWQEQVLRTLDVSAWECVQVEQELDLVGPVARDHLSHDRLLLPANAHSMVPLLRATGGRPLITGLGGDELFEPQQWSSLHELFARRRAPNGRDLLRLPAAALPRSIRGCVRPRDHALLDSLHWLTPRARTRVRHALGRLEEPIRWSAAIRHTAALRDVTVGLATAHRVAAAESGRLLAPFLTDKFVGAFARSGGWTGSGSRTATMRVLGSGLLPDSVLSRKSKASFNRVFFGPQSRAFAAAWRGGGVDPEIVDREALRQEWLSPSPDFRTALLLQRAWLAENQQRQL